VVSSGCDLLGGHQNLFDQDVCWLGEREHDGLSDVGWAHEKGLLVTVVVSSPS
jgi:hypothetical protein